MPPRLFVESLGVDCVAQICNYLSVKELRNMDDAFFGLSGWDDCVKSLMGHTALENTPHDLFDLDWMMDRGVVIRALHVRTSKSRSEYPFMPNPSLFNALTDLRLDDNAFDFCRELWSTYPLGHADGKVACSMNLESLSLNGEPMNLEMNHDLEALLASHCNQRLKHLQLTSLGDGITDDLFIEFSQVLTEASLQTLRLEFCERGTDLRAGLNPISFMCLAPKCSVLRVLELRNTYLLTDECLLMLSVHCGTLEELELMFCREIVGAGVRVLCHANPNMRRLALIDCSSLDDGLFFGNGVPNPDGSIIPGSSVGNGSSNNSSHSHSHNHNRRERSVEELWHVEGSPVWANLTNLTLDDSYGFSNAAFLLLPSLAPNIQALSIANCSFLRDTTLAAYFDAMATSNINRKSNGEQEPSCALRQVCLYGLPGVTEDSMHALMRAAPHLNRVGVTAKFSDHEIMKELERRGVQVDWIPWWEDE